MSTQTLQPSRLSLFTFHLFRSGTEIATESLAGLAGHPPVPKRRGGVRAVCEETLQAEYEAQVRDCWDWDAIHEEVQASGRAYLGSVTEIMPSGRFCAPWCGNIDDIAALRDDAFRDALERTAERFGLTIENGEDDPCDIFAVMEAGGGEE